ATGIDGTEVGAIKDAPGIRRDGGNALASAELYVILDLPKKSTPDSPANVPMRGIEPTGIPAREEISIIEGRMFRFGTNEVIVGRAANHQYLGLNVGDTIVSGQNRWAVVGVFEADGGLPETEIWCDVHTLQGVYRRTNAFSVVMAKLDTNDSFDTFSNWLKENPQVHASIYRENEFYRSQGDTMTRLIDTLGFGIASLMGIGA